MVSMARYRLQERTPRLAPQPHEVAYGCGDSSRDKIVLQLQILQQNGVAQLVGQCHVELVLVHAARARFQGATVSSSAHA